MKVKPNPSAGIRLYESRGGLVPSVTEILKVPGKPWIERWRHDKGVKEAKKAADESAALGTRIHGAAVQVARGERVTEDLMPYAVAVKDFLNMHVAECLKMELSLVSDRHSFGGTLDLYCRLMDGSYAVVDWKTTSSLTREHGLQTAAYALLCREHGMTVNRRIVVRIKKEAPGLYYARTYADHAGDVEAFLALKTYWHWAHRSKLERRAA